MRNSVAKDCFIETLLSGFPVGVVDGRGGSVFAERGGVWDEGNRPETYYDSVGAELHADVNFFYGLTARVRMGYAKGLDDVIGDERFYITLGASF